MGPRAPVRAVVGALSLFAFALTLRLLWVTHVCDPYANVYSDMQGYIDRAAELAQGRPEPFPRFLAFFPPGTHLVYALEMIALGWPPKLPFLIAHCAWGALVAPCVFLMGMRIVPRFWVMFPVGIVMAAWQPQLVYSGYFSSEEISMGLFALASLLLLRHAEDGSGALAAGLCAGAAYLVRPQFLLTGAILLGAWLLAKTLRRIPPRPYASRPRRAGRIAAILGVAVIVGATWHLALTQKLGLIADNQALQRLFADTDYGEVVAHEEGRTWLFAPPSKLQIGETKRYEFTGYIGDKEQLEKGRAEAVKRASLGWRAQHLVETVEMLAFRNELWPENGHLNDPPWRRAYNDVFKNIVIATLPFAAVGLLSTLFRPRAVLVIAAAQVATVLALAALFWGEARHRVPYDSFLLLLALEGARRLAAIAWAALTREGWRTAGD